MTTIAPQLTAAPTLDQAEGHVAAQGLFSRSAGADQFRGSVSGREWTLATVRSFGADLKLDRGDRGHKHVTQQEVARRLINARAKAGKQLPTAMLDYAKSDPQAMPFMRDVFVENMDWPGARQLAERLKRTIPPQVLGPDEQGQDDQMQQGMMAQQAQAQLQMQQQAAVAQISLQEAQAKLAKAQSDAQASQQKMQLDQRKTAQEMQLEAAKSRAQVEKTQAEIERIRVETAAKQAELQAKVMEMQNPVIPQGG